MAEQHECARLGCTRLTDEQECDLHAAEPAGVIHEPKEPRPSRDFEREHFEQALGCYRQSILDTLADEADSSMTREDVANARRREAKELDEVMSRWDTEHDAAKELAAERDAAKRQLVRLQTAFDAATKPDPRIEAWRAMDAADRANTVEDLRTWADLVERGLGDGGTGTHRGLFVAAAALEALGERP